MTLWNTVNPNITTLKLLAIMRVFFTQIKEKSINLCSIKIKLNQSCFLLSLTTFCETNVHKQRHSNTIKRALNYYNINLVLNTITIFQIQHWIGDFRNWEKAIHFELKLFRWKFSRNRKKPGNFSFVKQQKANENLHHSHCNCKFYYSYWESRLIWQGWMPFRDIKSIAT